MDILFVVRVVLPNSRDIRDFLLHGTEKIDYLWKKNEIGSLPYNTHKNQFQLVKN